MAVGPIVGSSSPGGMRTEGWERLVARNAPVNFDGLHSKREREGDYRFHDAVFAYARRVEIATIAGEIGRY